MRGEIPEDAGTFAAGTPYSAMDPELMLWTVAVMMDSAEAFYDLLVRRLDAGERESLWQDYLRFAALFEMPRESAPATYREFRAYWERRMARDELHLTAEAREMGYATAFEIPMPAIYGPLSRVHNLIMLGSLPPRVREMYGLSGGPRSRSRSTPRSPRCEGHGRWCPSGCAAAETATRSSSSRAPSARGA